MRTVTIVGVGRVGGALSAALVSAGYKIKHLVTNDIDASRAFAKGFAEQPVVSELDTLTKIETDLLFITTQDSQIKSVAQRIAGLGEAASGVCAFHCSGALSSGELSPLAACGYLTASVHPLVSVSDARSADSVFDGVFFAVEGNSYAVKTASQLVESIGGSVFEIGTEEKSLYHAAAVVACGHLVALFGTSVRILAHCGLDKKTARTVMLPLVESTLANLRHKEPAEALTGPFARGDVEVIAGHIQKLNEIADENMEDVYRILGLEAVELAASRGMSQKKIDEMREIILLDKRKTK